MRFLYIRLKNYIGIYNGMSLNQIEINFSNAINKVTVINGKNGCGKSTLLNALTVNPDPASCFIEN
jgi:ABC-type cobalamin/Fe3+-siderophores transport system ATPase subunit